MFIFSPPWIAHKNDKSHLTPIYSLAVHPLGNRLATGGQDSKIKLWNLDPVYEDKLESDSNTPKLLATLAAHSGSVLCVRWSNDDGTYLASGADDFKIVLWKQDKTMISRNLLIDTDSGPPVESWRAVKVLTGHESDVADLAWSPENKYLASCGFETTVYIWDGQGFDLIRKLSAHTAFVKGVTWDPVGKYLASQSDDKTTKIWRVADWSEEKSITKPYEAAASTTFFRRLSWSPEGSCLITANGESGNRPVAPMIQRDGWTTDLSLVGHRGPIECAAFNPQLFEGKAADGSTTTTAICAVGGQDNAISIWQSASAHSLLVSQDFFHHSILDLCWAPSGECLFACSYDGTIGVLAFDKDELGVLLPPGEKERALTTLGVKRKAVIESVAQLELEELARAQDKEASSTRISALLGPGSSSQPMSGPFTPQAAPAARPAKPIAQRVSQTPDGRKRITPTFLSAGPEATTFSKNVHASPKNGFSNRMSELKDSLESSPSSFGIPAASVKRKRTEVESGETEAVRYVLPTVMDARRPVNLAIPSLRPSIVIEVPTGKDMESLSLECDNNAKPIPKIRCNRGAAPGKEPETLWIDTVPSKVLQITGTPAFVAVACVDGSVYCYSPAGRRLLPCMFLEAPASFLTSQGDYLMCLTAIGTLNVWNVVLQTTTISRTSIIHLLRPPSGETENGASPEDDGEGIVIRSAYLRREGMPVLTTSTNESYTYHPNMQAWMKIGGGAELPALHLSKAALGSKTLAQLENHMACAATMRTAKEYQRWLKWYAIKLADEGAISKTQELCDDLLGPRHSPTTGSPGLSDTDWNPFILGMPKRALLTGILPQLSKNRFLQRTVQTCQEILSEIREEEQLKRTRV
ncbi:WD40-repeat-containing domain protein [Geranomyces variabilis]|nr:WD40-repeat-containing domain protein [Geranomyces variabilis]